MKKYFGFTLVEALMVMVLLGIIAAVMISIIKPGKFKEQALKVVAKDLYRGIESALDLVLVNYSPNNNFSKLYSPDKSILSDDISNQKHAYYLADEMKDYLSLSRNNKACTSSDTDLFNYCYDEVDGMKNAYFLKKGSWIKVKFSNSNINFAIPTAKHIAKSSEANIYILFDVNGNKEPNALGKDRFIVPLFNKNFEIVEGNVEEEANPCHPGCQTCDGPGVYECTSCKEGYKIVNGSATHYKNVCMPYLPAGEYEGVCGQITDDYYCIPRLEECKELCSSIGLNSTTAPAAVPNVYLNEGKSINLSSIQPFDYWPSNCPFENSYYGASSYKICGPFTVGEKEHFCYCKAPTS